MKSAMYAAGAVAALAVGVARAQSVDVAGAEGLLKKSGCLKCHSASADKDGPSFKKTAAKYKGQADAAAKVQAFVTTGPTIKVDGREERHDIIKSKDDREIRNAVAYILSR
jgi:cytochrome c